MSSAGRPGKAVIQRTGEHRASTEYKDRSDDGTKKELYEGSKGIIGQYRLRRQLRGLALAVRGVGCILLLSYKVIGAGIFYHRGRKDCRYELPPEKPEEKVIFPSVRVRITDNTGPMLLGHIIYVPERFFLEDDSLFRSIVLHEKEHIDRKHHLVLVLMNLTGCLYWFLIFLM